MTFNDLLGWPEYDQVGVFTNTDGDLKVEARLKITPDLCWSCGKAVPAETRLYRQGKARRQFHDTTVNGKRKIVTVVQTRWKCLGCGVTFWEPLPQMNTKRKLTNRAWLYVVDSAWQRDFRDVSIELGCNEDLVARAFKDWVETQDATHNPKTPEVLGIDEVQAIRRKKPWGVLTNIESSTMLDLLPEFSDQAFFERFRKIDQADRQRVRVVAMDQTARYRDLIRFFFPKAAIIADKYHLLAHLEQVFSTLFSMHRDTLREAKKTRAATALWLARPLYVKRWGQLQPHEQDMVRALNDLHPFIRLAWSLKEEFHSIYTCRTGADALEAFEFWKGRITPDVDLYRTEIAASIERWITEFTNYFEHADATGNRYTNAVTESLNGVLRSKQRQGRGYSFVVVRGFMLYKAGPRMLVRLDADAEDWTRVASAIDRRPLRPESPPPPGLLTHRRLLGYEDHGMPLSTIIEAVQQGRI